MNACMMSSHSLTMLDTEAAFAKAAAALHLCYTMLRTEAVFSTSAAAVAVAAAVLVAAACCRLQTKRTVHVLQALFSTTKALCSSVFCVPFPFPSGRVT